MTIVELITNIKENGFAFAQPYRESMRSSKWVLEVDNENNIVVNSFEGTREEMYEVYKLIMIGLNGKYEEEYLY